MKNVKKHLHPKGKANTSRSRFKSRHQVPEKVEKFFTPDKVYLLYELISASCKKVLVLSGGVIASQVFDVKSHLKENLLINLITFLFFSNFLEALTSI